MSGALMGSLAFMSPEWLAMAERELRNAVAATPGAARLRFSLVEHLRDKPAGAPGPDVLRIEIDQGQVIVGAGEAAGTAEVEIACDWSDAHRAAALPAGPELDAFNRERAAQGRLIVQGDLGAAKAVLAAAHDRIAARTQPPTEPRAAGETNMERTSDFFEEDEARTRERLDDQLASLAGPEALTIRQRIALACRFLAKEGHGGMLAGQVTARADTPGTYWTIAWDRGFANAHAGGVLLIDEEMNVIEGDGQPNPGVRFHLWIYRNRPRTMAIVHSHPPHAAALCMTNAELAVAHMDSAMFFEDIATLKEWPGLPVANEEGRIISEALGGKRSILLANHGLLTAGESLDEALYLACLLERACRMQLRAASAGTIRPLEPELAREARDFLLSPKLVGGTVNYWLRQMQRSEPEALR